MTTIGPEEHKIVAEHGTAKHWTIYDVGGSRAQRGEISRCMGVW